MKFLRSNAEHRRAADIRADIFKVDKAALSGKVSEIEQVRRRLLLSGTDEQLHENKRDLDNAMLQVERADTLLDELTRLASEADTREAAEALEAEYAAAMEAKAVLDQAIADAERVCAPLKSLLDEATTAARVVAKWNRGVEPGGQPDRRIVHNTPEVLKQRLMAVLR